MRCAFVFIPRICVDVKKLTQLFVKTKPSPWLLLLLIFSGATPGLFANTVEVDFYSEHLQLRYDPGLLAMSSGTVEEKSLIGFYKQMQRLPFQTLLNDLKREKERMALNDWLYYRLLRKSVDLIFMDKSGVERELLEWFMLNQSGYNARLTYLGKRVFVNVYTRDEIFEAPVVEDKGKRFVNLSSISGEHFREGQALFLLNFIPNPEGLPFSFYLKKLPALAPVTVARHLSFNYRGKTYAFDVEADQTLVEIMKDYPLIAEFQYLETPFSPTLRRDLLARFQEWTQGMAPYQTLEFLATFTRSAFVYKGDKVAFGKNKPMITDEVFFYPQSDCEDRVALMYNLVKSLLDLPMIAVAYPDHLTLAVDVPDAQGATIPYKGRRYLICDPTGPINSSTIGEVPNGYEKAKFEIIGYYK